MAATRWGTLVSGLFVNGNEGRLRAGWRLLVALLAAAVALVATAETLVAITAGGVNVPDAVGRALVKLAIAIALVAVAWTIDTRVVSDVGLGGDDWWRNLAFGLALGVVMTTLMFGIGLALGLLTVENTFVSGSESGLTTDVPFALAFLIVFWIYVLVGVSEEVIVRGYLMTNLAEGLNDLGPIDPRTAIAVAAVLTSGIFGLLHLGNPNATTVSTLNITALGLFFAATYVATDDLGIAIGVHVTWNFSLSAVYGFPVSGFASPVAVFDVRQTGGPLLTGGQFGPEAGLVIYLALAVAVALSWWWVRHTRGPVGFPPDVAVPDLRHAGDVSQGALQKPPEAAGGTGGGVDHDQS